MADEKKDLAELAKQYDASQIQVLEGLEAVRKRPGLLILGFGWHHIVLLIQLNLSFHLPFTHI